MSSTSSTGTGLSSVRTARAGGPGAGTSTAPEGRTARHPGRTAARPVGCPAARAAAPRPAASRSAAVRSVGAPSVAAHPAARSEGRPVPARAHLTGRGRVVVVAGLVLLLLAAFSLGRAGAEGSTEVQPRAALEQTTVQPGDTLWAVAQRLAPGQDPRPVVDQIRRLNGLATAELQAGQQLLLPVRG